MPHEGVKSGNRSHARLRTGLLTPGEMKVTQSTEIRDKFLSVTAFRDIISMLEKVLESNGGRVERGRMEINHSHGNRRGMVYNEWTEFPSKYETEIWNHIKASHGFDFDLSIWGKFSEDHFRDMHGIRLEIEMRKQLPMHLVHERRTRISLSPMPVSLDAHSTPGAWNFFEEAVEILEVIEGTHGGIRIHSGSIPDEYTVRALRRGKYESAFPAFYRYPVGTISCSWNVTLAHSRGDPAQCRAQARWLRWIGDCADKGVVLVEGSASALYMAATRLDVGSAERVRRVRLAAENDDAVEWTDRIARALAAYELGGRYRDDGDDEAARWFHRAAEDGEDCAQNDLGDMYANGRGVPRDDIRALIWFRRSAVQDNDTAQMNLGIMYFLGRGVSRDYAKAARWFRRSAEQNNDVAQAVLGTMYAKGLGVARDDGEAAKWFLRVAKSQEDLRAWSEYL